MIIKIFLIIFDFDFVLLQLYLGLLYLNLEFSLLINDSILSAIVFTLLN